MANDSTPRLSNAVWQRNTVKRADLKHFEMLLTAIKDSLEREMRDLKAEMRESAERIERHDLQILVRKLEGRRRKAEK